MLKEIFTKKSNRPFLIVSAICVVLLLCGVIAYAAVPGFQNRVNSLIGVSEKSKNTANNTTNKSPETITTEKTTQVTTSSPDVNTETAPPTTTTPEINTTAPATTPDPTPDPTASPDPTQVPIAFEVSSTTASVSPETGPSICNKQTSFEFIFSGTITVTAAGTVQYKWVQSNGVESAGTLTFTTAGTMSVPDNSWIVYGGSLFTGWGKLVVTSPNSISSNQANFTRLFCPIF